MTREGPLLGFRRLQCNVLPRTPGTLAWRTFNQINPLHDVTSSLHMAKGLKGF